MKATQTHAQCVHERRRRKMVFSGFLPCLFVLLQFVFFFFYFFIENNEPDRYSLCSQSCKSLAKSYKTKRAQTKSFLFFVVDSFALFLILRMLASPVILFTLNLNLVDKHKEEDEIIAATDYLCMRTVTQKKAKIFGISKIS